MASDLMLALMRSEPEVIAAALLETDAAKAARVAYLVGQRMSAEDGPFAAMISEAGILETALREATTTFIQVWEAGGSGPEDPIGFFAKLVAASMRNRRRDDGKA